MELVSPKLGIISGSAHSTNRVPPSWLCFAHQYDVVIECAAWVQVLALPLISSVTLGKLFNHFVLQFS